MILVVSHLADEHAIYVLERLARANADAVLVDTGRFPRELRIAIEHGARATLSLVVDGVERDLAAARMVWWRRPLPFALHAELAGDEDRSFAYGECQAAMSGLWACLDAHWMNDPERDEVAARKAYQLKVAARLGWRVPRTLVTNDAAKALAFVEAEGDAGTIYKAFSATEHAWRETRLLRAEERDLLPAVRFAPVIFQEYIRSSVDLRVTVVGDAVFPAEIVTSDGGYPVDFRMSMHASAMRAHVLPAEVTERVLALTRALGLAYGAIDLRLSAEGEYVFLEINPSGQWLFIEERTGQPITDAVVAYLRGHDDA